MEFSSHRLMRLGMWVRYIMISSNSSIHPCFNFFYMKKLAMDALIQTLGARLVGHLDCVHVIPMIASAAPPASASSNVNETSVQTPPLTTAMQVYLVPSSSSSSPAFTLLQLRSSVVKLKGATMCKSLLQDWIVKAMFRDLVIVGGLDASGRVDGEING